MQKRFHCHTSRKVMKNKSYLKFFSYGNIGMQLGVCFGHLMFDLKLFLQFFKLDAALVPTTNQGLVRRSNNSTQAQRVLGTAQNHYFQAIIKGFLWLNKSWFPVCSVQREWWFGLRRFYEYESQGPPVCDFVETPIISGRMNDQLKTRCCCLGDMTSSSV